MMQKLRVGSRTKSQAKKKLPGTCPWELFHFCLTGGEDEPFFAQPWLSQKTRPRSRQR